jgi:sucrose-6-phosphate hydrolase SacC (GH32 family)
MKFMSFAGMLLFALCAAAQDRSFPPELVNFQPYGQNPLFTGAGPGHWDQCIRERGWIMKEDGLYHMWYTGYVPPESNEKHLGYATSPDGITWTRHEANPIYAEKWVEDMTVVKEGDTYYMFAEGVKDRAHWLVSQDRIHWTSRGVLDIRKHNGKPISDGPFGTPAVIRDNGKWYLLYERNDEAIWLAASDDLRVWTNVQDDPVIRCGPEAYDRKMVAVNQVIKYKDRFYAYYHATCTQSGKDLWSMNVAASDDLIHWEKYPGNPIIKPDYSSGILVNDGTAFRLYCMHQAVSLFLPAQAPAKTDKP